MLKGFQLEPLNKKMNSTALWEDNPMFLIPIDRNLEIPLIKQIYQYIRDSILNGSIQTGEKLPSTRELSTNLGVSRNVILEAYDQLCAEGYLIACGGSGTYVAEGTFLERPNKQEVDYSFKELKGQAFNKDIIDFQSGIPDLKLFPRKIWAKLSRETWNDADANALSYNHPEGRYELREILARYLFKTRGVVCHPEQIVITSGATQALTLVANLLLSQSKIAVMEDPITTDIQTIFKASGASLYPIPVDENGMITSMLPAHIDPALIFITPSHQFPIGGTLPIQRRIQLIYYARKTNSYIVEDDYDSEFRYEGQPVSSVQGLEQERVIYIGTFSKILSPALRIGYIVLPIHLIERCREFKWFSDLHTPSIDQLILARFIKEGYLERHIMKMKKVYKKRRDLLIELLKESFSNQIAFLGHSTGLHFVMQWNDMYFIEKDFEKVAKFGVKIYPVEEHLIEKGKHRNCTIIGYGHLNDEEIFSGVRRLKQAIELIR